MNKLIIVVAFSITALAAGCKEEAKTVKWYKDHPDELKVVYAKCQGTGESSENCENASEAHYQIKQLNAPSLKFH